MKLRRDRIRNFRILKEIDLEFSLDSERNVTVIRAANESGKTTLLTALQWGLYGDGALPDKGRTYRLSPVDASKGNGRATKVRVEIDYLDSNRNAAYRVIRTVDERADRSSFERGPSDVKLFKITENGASPLDSPESHVESQLPRELREVYFTDGDRALSFIEGSQGETRQRVEEAIRSLLDLGVLEEASGHLNLVIRGIAKNVKRESGGQKELRELSDRLERLHEEIPHLEQEWRDAAEASKNLSEREREADGELAHALREGNREDLVRQQRDARQGRRAADQEAQQAGRDHSDLFKSDLLARDLLGDQFRKAGRLLDGLRRRGKIPNQSIPVLEERLRQSACICGETLDEGSEYGRERRAEIRRLIEDSRNTDRVQEKVTAVYFEARSLWEPTNRAWIESYRRTAQRMEKARQRSKKCGEDERVAEIRIQKLPDVDVRQLKESRDHYRRQFQDARDRKVRTGAELDTRRTERARLEGEYQRKLQQDSRNMKYVKELEVARDLKTILDGALDSLNKDHLYN